MVPPSAAGVISAEGGGTGLLAEGSPGWGGSLHTCDHVHPPARANTHKRFFSNVLPLQNRQGFGASWKRRAVVFSPSFLSLRPTQSDDLQFILLYFLWFVLAASNYFFSFGKRYHPVLLHSCFLFHSGCLRLLGLFLSSPCHSFFSSML